jgi:hypothetical protein
LPGDEKKQTTLRNEARHGFQFTLKMEVSGSSETLAPILQTSRRLISKDNDIQYIDV